MQYRDLRDFIAQLETTGELRRIAAPVDPHLEMTALSDRSLQSGGPAFLFERPEGHGRTWSIPALTNLFGTTRRVALGMGANNLSELRDVGRLLAALKEPDPPRALKDVGRLFQMAKAVWDMKPSVVRDAPCQEAVRRGEDIDLGELPVQLC